MRISLVIEKVKDNQNFTISYKKAWRARKRAIEMVFGDWDDSYRKLPRFMAALQEYNPGTVVEWLNHRTGTENRYKFQYLFQAFKPSIDGFTHCGLIILIDGTHLNGKYKGKILVAMGVTAANTCYPLAFAIVDEETIASWSWFLRHLSTHVVQGRNEICLISH